jgi:hypothetical protein
MGMTIEESMKVLQEVPKVMPITEESINVALDTMRKYQKIDEAYKKYLNDMVTNIYADGKFIVALRGILEDGNEH